MGGDFHLRFGQNREIKMQEFHIDDIEMSIY